MAGTRRDSPGPPPGPDDPDLFAAISAIQGANPFVGLTRAQMIAALAQWARHLLQHPALVASRGAGIVAEDLRILAGMSPVEADARDRRFSDPAWSSPVWRRVEQAYLARRASLLSTVDEMDLDPKSAQRARFVLMQLAEAMAPTNYLASNPVALRRLRETGGQSIVKGLRHFAWDVRHNGGLPSQVDTRAFEVGKNIALTPGAVVQRAEQYELLQYQPTTPRVQRRPVVVVSPQINKYYFLDIAPGRSFVEHAVAQGLQVFMVSWRNAKPENRDWSVDTYVTALRQAIETACEISGSEDALTIGFCAGGMTVAMLTSHLAAIGAPLIAASAMAVAMVDTQAKSSLNAFLTERSAASSVARSERRGVLDGKNLAKVFAWVRPNDLVWNYWVSNYLLGESPPAFDVLAWNSDTTDLPAALHAGFVRLMMDNSLMKKGSFEVLGTPVDLSTVKTDLYLVGAATDHLVPWQSVYAGTQVHGGRSRFVLSNSGHIQALINPPDNPKASYMASDQHPASADEWLRGAERKTGSWWTDWARWAIERGGGEHDAPTALGSTLHPPLGPAPGTYVHDDRRTGHRRGTEGAGLAGDRATATAATSATATTATTATTAATPAGDSTATAATTGATATATGDSATAPDPSPKDGSTAPGTGPSDHHRPRADRTRRSRPADTTTGPTRPRNQPSAQ